METSNLVCTYEERTSKKDNKKYKAIFIKLSDEYEKMIFLSVPETVLLEKYLSTKVIDNNSDVEKNPFSF